MSERLELSFKNKEVRMCFYFIVPALIIGNLFLLMGGATYNYVLWVLLAIAWITFYTWRFLYRKKQNNNPS